MDNAGESKAVNGAVVALNRPNGEYVSGFLGGRGQPRHPSWAPDVGPEPVAICLEECAVALLERVLSERPETPEVVFLPTRAAERYRCMADLKQAVSADTGLDVEFAYSLKTNYFNGLIDMAREQDFLVEAISQLEAQKAIAAGFEAGQIILNGPAKWWPRMLVSSPVRAVFCDSVEELETLSRRNPRLLPLRESASGPPRTGHGLAWRSIASVPSIVSVWRWEVDEGLTGSACTSTCHRPASARNNGLISTSGFSTVRARWRNQAEPLLFALTLAAGGAPTHSTSSSRPGWASWPLRRWRCFPGCGL